MKLLNILVVFAILCSTPCLHSEIEFVTITWNPMLCKGSCPALLEKQFKKIPGIAEYNIDQAAGQATLKWKPNVPYSFGPINTAMRMVGPSIKNIRLRVHGSIQHTKDNVYLISRGDNTRLSLINPVIPDPKGQSVQYNLAGRTLTPAMRQQFLDAEAKNQIATVEGPLFMTERHYSPEVLVVDQVSFEDNKPQK